MTMSLLAEPPAAQPAPAPARIKRPNRMLKRLARDKTTVVALAVFLAIVGIKLPGLEFRNQRVEAAYRKELVYGEDDASRADPPTARHLFANVRRNYFRLYFHYMYFNVARIFYLQLDNVFGYVILAPSIVAGAITLGAMNQILNALGQVRTSFQYLVNSWTTIVELISIYKRLRAFEATIRGDELPDIDRDFLAAARQRGAEPLVDG